MIDIETQGEGIQVDATPIQEETKEEQQEQQTVESTDVDTNTQPSVEEITTKRQEVENDIREDLKTKGVDFDEVAKEFNENGQLSEATMKQLEKAGYPKSVVDNYIKGLEAETQMFTNAVFDSVGGQEEYAKIADFIRSQGQEQVDAFNNIVSSGNLNAIKMALKGVQAEMVKTYGTNNKTILGSNGTVTTGLQGFANKDEMMSAMRDKRYGRDKSYTREVEQRVIKSEFF